MQRKKILTIAYSFPPSGTSGVYRTLSFVKYLPENGYRPIVLTVPEDSYLLKDSSLLNDIPGEVGVVRIPYWGAKTQKFFTKKEGIIAEKRASIINTIIKWISIPDSLNRWIPNAYLAGKKIIDRENIDLIWSTSPINSAHLVGYLLKKKLNIPWVVDFRDPWIPPFVDNKNILWRKINEFLESRVLNKADVVITVSNKLREDLISRYPNINPKKFLVITNGFEKEDFRKEKYSPTDKFTITHTGRFYGKRTPLPFLLALKQSFLEDPEMERKTRVRFVGTFEGRIEEEIKKIGMWKKIEVIPQIFHDECIKYQCQSDVLLLIPGPNTLTVPGKIFEYLAAQRPILALTQEDSDSANLIKETKSGIVINPLDIFQIKKEVKNLFFSYKKGKLNSKKYRAKISKYSRFCLTRKLCKVFDSLTTKENNKTIRSVVENGLCVGCGTCVGICPNSSIKMTKNASKSFFIPKLDDKKCNQCGGCFEACPGHSVDFVRLNLKIFGRKSEDILIGNYISCYAGHATDSKIRYNSASGGMITALLIFALKKKFINGALVTRMSDDNPLESESFIARTEEELIEASKSKYCPVPANIRLRDILNSKKKERFAVVGLPCHIQAIGKAEVFNKRLKEKIVLHLGLFCSHSPTFLGTEFLLQQLGVKKEEILKIDYRGKGWPGIVSITLRNGRIISIPYNKAWITLGSYFYPMRCMLCPDHTCELADISFGDAWGLPDFSNNKVGESIVISRSRIGENILLEARLKEKVETIKISRDKVVQSQEGGLRFKKQDLKARLLLFKIFNKKVPIYNIKLLKPTFGAYPRSIFWYSMIFISSKRYLWHLLSILLILRHGSSWRSRFKNIFRKFK